jgi:site-specific DNA-methyltransferase (adenine-specific)
MSSSERMDWPTPVDYFATLHDEFGFTVDACAHADNAKLPRYWSEYDEGLMQSWAGERVYMNPPYGRQLPLWVAKAWNEQNAAALIVALIPARVDTSYWHNYIFGHAEIRFLRGRLRFEGAVNVAPFPVAVVIWR